MEDGAQVEGARSGGSRAWRRAVRGRLAAGLAAVAHAPVLLLVAASGLGLLLVAPAALVLLGVAAHRLVTPGNDLRVTLAAGLSGALVARYGVTAALAGNRLLAEVTRRLSASWLGVPIASPYVADGRHAAKGLAGELSSRLGDPAGRRDLLWLLLDSSFGWILTTLPAALLVVGAAAAVEGLGAPFPGNGPAAPARPALVAAGAVVSLLAVLAAPTLHGLYGELAATLLGPPEDAALAQRVRHLAATRAESLDAGAAELRRIERDLHDGTQARLVAMGMTLSAARDLLDTDPEAARRLLADAVDASASALAELRALVRGIHPPVLADRGLVDAVRAHALESPLAVEVDAELAGRLSPPVESAAYFALSELLANASRHSGAGHVHVRIRRAGGILRLEVGDDGCGGIDPSRGTGLRGIERRLAAFDGHLAITSPPGGPSTVSMEIPCAS